MASLDWANLPPLLIWIAATLTVRIVGNWLLWIWPTGAAKRPAGIVTLASNLLLLVVRILYMIGIPYLALIQGIINLRVMGLFVTDWSVDIRTILPFVVAAALCIGWSLWRYLATIRPWHLIPEQTLPWWINRTVSAFGWGSALAEAAMREVHWAFYRSLPLLLVANGIWANFIGLGIVYLEGLAIPQVRQNLQEPGEGEEHILTASLAVVSTVCFYLTGNLWLCIVLHTLLLTSASYLMAWRLRRPTRVVTS
ncbi:MAG: hypothetical protein EXR62_01960 [Chloroflexi bacterium]|nr:hypothetical protein [Chloroflexota bacterium]